jgi:hypothetical protein
MRRALALLLLAAGSAAAGDLRFTKVAGPETGGAVLDLGPAGAFDGAWVAAPSVLRTGRTYRMWYSSLFDSKMGRGGIGLATSPDGVRWRRENGGRPLLSPGPAGAFDEGQVGFPEVLFDGVLYRMWYAGMSAGWHESGFGHYRVGLATSRDGVVWERANGGRPVLDLGPAGAPDEVQAGPAAVLAEAGGYRMWYAAWSPQRSHTIVAARSADGIRWTRENGGEPVRGLRPWEAYGPAVCRVGEQYYILFMALRAERALYAARSRDGIEWEMLAGGAPVLGPGATDAFDGHYAGHASIVQLGQTLRVWYTGYRHDPAGVRGMTLRIGLAEAALPQGGRAK